MASGRLGKGVAGAASYNVIYAAPGSITSATVNILVCNTSAAERKLRLAISNAATPGSGDFIAYDLDVPVGGRSESTAVMMSPGENVLAYGDAAGLIVRIHGVERT